MAAFVVTVAGAYSVDYQWFDPSPSAAVPKGLPDVRYDQRSIDQARARLGLSEPDEAIESFTVVPPEPVDYLSVPATEVRLFFCAGQPADEFCDPHSAKATAFRLDHVVHYDRSGGTDSWDFVFVPDTPRVGPLRFVYRSDTGGLFGLPDDFGFVLGGQREETGLEIENRIAKVRAFADSSFADEFLDSVADDAGKEWWGEVPGGFDEVDSDFLGRAGITTPPEAWDLWSTVVKVARWFAVLTLMVGFLASLAGLSGSGAGLLRRIVQIPKGVATALGVLLGVFATGAYFLIVGAEAKQEATDRADRGVERVFTGSLAEVNRRASSAGIEVEGLGLLRKSIPQQAALQPFREAPPEIRGGAMNGDVIVSSPLMVKARVGKRAAWRLEIRTSITVHVYQGPTADVMTIEIDNARVFPTAFGRRASRDRRQATVIGGL